MAGKTSKGKVRKADNGVRVYLTRNVRCWSSSLYWAHIILPMCEPVPDDAPGRFRSKTNLSLPDALRFVSLTSHHSPEVVEGDGPAVPWADPFADGYARLPAGVL